MSAGGQEGLTRRGVLCRSAAGAVLFLAWPVELRAGDAVEAAIASLLAGRGTTPSGRVSIEVPYTFEYGVSVPLGITVDSPMTALDHVRRVDVLAEGNPLPEVLSFHFVPDNGPARIATRFRLDEGNHRVWVVAQMSDGAVLTGSAEVVAAKGGCGGNSGIEPGAPEPQPVPRINLPERVGKGDILDVPSMIAHRMETGFRTDARGNPLPRRIINRMECHYAGRMVFAADLSPAIAANAYLKFPLQARETGDVAFAWHEDGGTVYRATRHIEVD
jgi:thiosulfate oxidation carrier complex protein SoxZ